MLRDAKVLALIAEGRAELRAVLEHRYEITTDKLPHTLATSAFASLGDRIADDGTPQWDFTRCGADQLSALKSITIEHFTEGSGEDAREVRKIRLEPRDRAAAVVHLLKIRGDYVERRDGDAPTIAAIVEAIRGAVSCTSALQPRGTAARSASRTHLSQRLRRAADLRRDRLDRRPLAQMIGLVRVDHSNRPLAHLGCISHRCFPHGSVLSQSGASGKPGAVQKGATCSRVSPSPQRPSRRWRPPRTGISE